MKRQLTKLLPIIDLLSVAFVFPAGWLLRSIRQAGLDKMPLCKKALFKVGVLPIRDHYYEPEFKLKPRHGTYQVDRPLPGIDWNEAGQLELLEELTYANEIPDAIKQRHGEVQYSWDNGNFIAGDVDFLYQIIRAKKPRRIFEIGSGSSTIIAATAVQANQQDDANYTCRHQCVEPYERHWLESLPVTVVREKVETLDLAIFQDLERNDLLFIDSSHIIRPEGDVLHEYLQILPTLKPGVIVHVHDIFSPRNYPDQWLLGLVRFWNEQYILESFLTHNSEWSIIAALNFLHHRHHETLKGVCPFLREDTMPGSFYLQRN
ncbi:class I SAM-dependent methyltransferase [Cerasicoccus frondis]|uniref:class I SAM-dependent methyltransferase n=1 Tax=Cerasicoccus frondis TaxID=490090 RepID=UPI002852AB24|nr:class I SAM-dependent methyltransferase [Cerasicoccus frondis]